METETNGYDCPKITQLSKDIIFMFMCIIGKESQVEKKKKEKGKNYETIVLFGFQFGNHEENTVNIPQETKMH